MESQDQQRVIAFLKSPAAWDNACTSVECIETHGALIFLCADRTRKIRRAARFSYMDFSTLEARRQFAEREFELNKPHAPELYHRVVPIRETADGKLTVGGEGRVVEWAVEMTRFAQSDLLSAVVEAKGVDDRLARSLAEAVFAYHAASPSKPDAPDRIAKNLTSVMTTLADRPDPEIAAIAGRIAALGASILERSATIRAERRNGGFIRRCHGDLHLGNIVLWNGNPVPFDAIEFDEAIATVDTLYDLAFLLMDLCRHGARRAANIVLNHYLWLSGDQHDLEGLATMPLYLALRASIRAMVTLDRANLGVGDSHAQRLDALSMLVDAENHLHRKRPMLLAIGGFSGTGKTTLARALAPALWPTPGAIHVRTDLERKWLAGVAEGVRLPSTAYTPEASRAAYVRVMHRAETALAAGHSVVIDAVFAKPEERAAVEALAARSGVDFCGLWLAGSADTLKARVAARKDDASDATPNVVDKQFGYQIGDVSWTTVDCGGAPADTELRARNALDLP